MTKSPTGAVTSFKGDNGHEAKFDSKGNVREVHANGVTVSHGPNGMRRTEIEREDHSRLVAYGRGRGYVQHEYSYNGHRLYSRAYYYHGGYYRGYYHPYYYRGVYLVDYMPAYYYPAVYFGWAYTPWGEPVPYAWGWGAYPWYGYYGAYYAPYPVYPSAAYWLTDYTVGASLAEAYSSTEAGDSAHVRALDSAHLVYASYDTGTTSPAMTKEVKDAIANEIALILAYLQKITANPAASGNRGGLEVLLSDGKPHVLIASTGLTVTSSGTDCGLTEGDVLALNAPPEGDATTANLRVLASKPNDCAAGKVVSVELNDMQEMLNHLLLNIDRGMTEIKDHPGQGGLPAPPADAVSGIKPAPYVADAPPADPSEAADLDKAAQQGAQVEQQVVAEAAASAAPDATAQSTSPIGGLATSTPAAPPAPTGPMVIAIGQTPEQVVAAKGQPASKVNFPGKIVYIYPDMKITFKDGKLADVQ